MTKLKEDSLVKRFGKKATVIVDICGDKDTSFARDNEKQTTDTRQEIIQEMLLQQREISMDR